MKMETFISYMFLIVIVWTCSLHLSVANPDCGDRQYRNGSDFQRNLNQVLASLVGNVSTSGFYTTSVEGQNSTVYGLVQCRGDLNSSDCKASASTAKRSLLEQCPNATSGSIVHDDCFLRYDNHNFYNVYTDNFTKICNSIIANEPELFGNFTEEVLSEMIERTVRSPNHFAKDKFKSPNPNLDRIYSLAQCWRDLSETNCRSCLAAGRSILSGPDRPSITEEGCQTGALGGHYLSTNCILRYGIYSFFDISIFPSLPPPPPPPPGESSPVSPPLPGESSPVSPPLPGESSPVSSPMVPPLPGESSPVSSPMVPPLPGERSPISSPLPGESSPVSSPPAGESSPVSLPLPGGKRSKVLGITLGILAATLGSIAAICLWKWNTFCSRKPQERISRTRSGERGEINLSRTVANPELIFKYDILRKAASNFKEENKLGEGGFGSVFKGVLPDAREVAIKRLNIGSRQGDNEFLNEANLISRVQHRNLVKLLGCCVESSERLLVYEFLQNGSLDKILFDTTKRQLLQWRDRLEIIVGTARGLAYLHEESEIRIIHRDIKASNILLDHKNKPKIADFGLAKLFAEDQSHVSTRVAGTLGYMAPEYALRGQLTEKADVFSFGVLVLEIISGRKNQSLPQHMEFLIEATWKLYKEERPLEVMDPTLEGSYSSEEAMKVIKIGLLCIQATAALRPSMSRVVSMLIGEQEHLSLPTRPAFIDLDCVATPHQVQRLRIIDPDKRSSSTETSSTPLSSIHSAAVDPSSGTLEPR